MCAAERVRFASPTTFSRWLGAWSFFGAFALAVSAATVPAVSAGSVVVNAAFDEAVALPGFVAQEGKKAPRVFYGEVPGMQILSIWSERETRDFVQELQVQRFLLSQLFPEELRTPLPL